MNWDYSCERAAEMLSQRCDEPLTWSEELRLRVHLVMCNNCRHAEEQLRAIRSAMHSMFDDPPEEGGSSREP